MAKNAIAAGWPIKSSFVSLPEDAIHVALAGGNDAWEAARARVRTEGAKAIEELKRSPAAEALAAQRQLLESTRADLQEAQGCVAEARRLRGEALRLGKHPGEIENALARSVAAAGGLSSREAELLALIEAREHECAELWNDLRRHLYEQLRREAPGRLAAAATALAAALPTALAREICEATAMSSLMGSAVEQLALLPEKPLGRTTAPPAPPPAAPVEPKQFGPSPPIPEPIKCPSCRETAHVEVDGVKHESVLMCPRCGPFDPPADHELCGQVLKMPAPQRPLSETEPLVAV